MTSNKEMRFGGDEFKMIIYENKKKLLLQKFDYMMDEWFKFFSHEPRVHVTITNPKEANRKERRSIRQLVKAEKKENVNEDDHYQDSYNDVIPTYNNELSQTNISMGLGNMSEQLDNILINYNPIISFKTYQTSECQTEIVDEPMGKLIETIKSNMQFIKEQNQRDAFSQTEDEYQIDKPALEKKIRNELILDQKQFINLTLKMTQEITQGKTYDPKVLLKSLNDLKTLCKLKAFQMLCDIMGKLILKSVDMVGRSQSQQQELVKTLIKEGLK